MAHFSFALNNTRVIDIFVLKEQPSKEEITFDRIKNKYCKNSFRHKLA